MRALSLMANQRKALVPVSSMAAKRDCRRPVPASGICGDQSMCRMKRHAASAICRRNKITRASINSINISRPGGEFALAAMLACLFEVVECLAPMSHAHGRRARKPRPGGHRNHHRGALRARYLLFRHGGACRNVIMMSSVALARWPSIRGGAARAARLFCHQSVPARPRGERRRALAVQTAVYA